MDIAQALNSDSKHIANRTLDGDGRTFSPSQSHVVIPYREIGAMITSVRPVDTTKGPVQVDSVGGATCKVVAF
jgi:hypothetical protein